MSIKRMTDVWENSPLTGCSLLVHLALADFANDKGQCWPSLDTIAKKARISRRAAIKIVNQMTKSGIIQKSIRLDEDGDQASNLYVVKPLGGSEQNAPGGDPTDTGVVNGGSLGVVNGGSPKPSIRTVKETTAWAEKVFSLWPRRDAKHAAMLLIEKFIKEFKGTEEAAARWLGVRMKRQLTQYASEDRKLDKIPHLRTWMYQKRYDDETLQDKLVVRIPLTTPSSVPQEQTEAMKRKVASGKK